MPLWAPDARWIAVGNFQGTVSLLTAADLSPWREPLDTHVEYALPDPRRSTAGAAS